MTRNSPLTATGAHVSVIGHITPLELRQELKTTDMASGFINRFVLVLVKRQHLLPVGGRLDETDPSQARGSLHRRGANVARDVEVLTARDEDALAHWTEVPASDAQPSGSHQHDVDRAPAHVLRLSALYALADESPTIQQAPPTGHARGVEYAEASATLIFGAARRPSARELPARIAAE